MRENSLREWALSNAKSIADLLTGLRFFCALVIVFCALTASPHLLPLVVIFTIIGWTTDILDGRMARMDSMGRRTWIGDHDFAVDMVLIYSGLLYFIAADYLPFWPFFCYGIYAAVTAFVWTKKSVMMAVAAPVASLPLVFSLIHYPLWGWVFLGWIVLALVANWRRFTGIVGGFIEDMEDA